MEARLRAATPEDEESGFSPCDARSTCMRAECSLWPKKARTEENLSEERAALLTPAATGFEICRTARKKSLYTSTIASGEAADGTSAAQPDHKSSRHGE